MVISNIFLQEHLISYSHSNFFNIEITVLVKSAIDGVVVVLKISISMVISNVFLQPHLITYFHSSFFNIEIIALVKNLLT